MIGAGNRRGIWIALWLSLLGLLGPCLAHSQDEVLRQAEALLNQRQPAQAAALLSDYEDRLAGIGDFAYLYGLALFESGQPERAIPYLERATTADPMFAGVRIELARAYFQVGRYEESQVQFEYLVKLNPPPAAQRAIAEYLAAIDLRLARQDWRSRWRLRPSVGWDSNANAASELNEFLGFVLDQNSRRTESSYGDLYGTGTFSKSLGGGRSVHLGGELQGRHYPDAGFADTMALVARAGMNWSGNNLTRGLRVRAYRLNVDDKFNSQGLSLEASWDMTVNTLQRVGMFARLGALRFDRDFENRDVDQLLVGLSATHVVGRGRRGLVTLSALLGSDDPQVADSRYGRELYGLRGSAVWALEKNLSLTLSGGWQRYLYQQPFFPAVDAERRLDRVADGALNLVWKSPSGLEAALGVNYRDQRSSVSLFSYDRWVLSLALSRGW